MEAVEKKKKTRAANATMIPSIPSHSIPSPLPATPTHVFGAIAALSKQQFQQVNLLVLGSIWQHSYAHGIPAQSLQ